MIWPSGRDAQTCAYAGRIVKPLYLKTPPIDGNKYISLRSLSPPPPPGGVAGSSLGGMAAAGLSAGRELGDWGGTPDLMCGGGGAWHRRPEGEMAVVAHGRIASMPLDGAHHMGAGAAAPAMAVETSLRRLTTGLVLIWSGGSWDLTPICWWWPCWSSSTKSSICYICSSMIGLPTCSGLPIGD